MTFIVLAPPLHAQLLPFADIADPPRRGRTIGAPDSVARVESQIPAAYHRDSDGTTPPLGWSVSATYALDDGQVDIRYAIAEAIIAMPGCPPGLAIALSVIPEPPGLAAKVRL